VRALAEAMRLNSTLTSLNFLGNDDPGVEQVSALRQGVFRPEKTEKPEAWDDRKGSVRLDTIFF